MKTIIVLAVVSLFTLHTTAHPVDSKLSDITARQGPTISNSAYGIVPNPRSAKMILSPSDADSYSRAQDLYITKRKEYNKQKIRLMMLETGPVRRDVESGMEYYQNSMEVAKRRVEMFEARFDTTGRNKLD